MTLLNVRLDSEDMKRVRELRAAGIPISGLVRRAIRAEHERRIKPNASTEKPSELVGRVLAELPDDGSIPPPGLDTTDREAVRDMIARRLRRGA
ncbi:MAG: ribbon-helix-helix protein, CopG family [Deltaproteobacteria bacterium]|nr:ribbon-helix-helix protein, CopG family [Deltaproteobacteria bacterium]